MSYERNLLTSSYTSKSLSFVYNDEDGNTNDTDTNSGCISSITAKDRGNGSYYNDDDDDEKVIEELRARMKRKNTAKRGIPGVKAGVSEVLSAPSEPYDPLNDYYDNNEEEEDDDDEPPVITAIKPATTTDNNDNNSSSSNSMQSSLKKEKGKCQNNCKNKGNNNNNNNKKKKKTRGYNEHGIPPPPPPQQQPSQHRNSNNNGDNDDDDENAVIDYEFAKLEKAKMLECENDKHGNVEYKFKLVGVSAERKVHLATQMQFRLCEGHGEAIYEVGVHDNGTPLGLPQAELDETVATLRELGATLNADVSVMRVMAGLRGRVAEVLVRQRKTSPGDFSEVRVAVVGPFNAGKTTLLSVMLSGKKDDGCGRARVPMLHHRHEILSGVTSSIGHAYLGFTSKGDAVEVRRDHGAGAKYEVAGNDDQNTFVDDDAMGFFARSSSTSSCESGIGSLNSSTVSAPQKTPQSDSDFCGFGDDSDEEGTTNNNNNNGGGGDEDNYDDDDADDDILDLLGDKHNPSMDSEDMSEVVKRIHFIDLCGHKKYMKTTLYGLSANRLDCIMLVVAATTAAADGGIDDTTVRLLEISKALALPLVLVVTKIDSCGGAGALESTCRRLRSLLQAPGMYKSVHRVECEEDLSCWKPPDPSVVPLFCVSNVTLANVGLLVKFFNMVPASENWEQLSRRPVEFVIDASWDLAEGTVCSGTLTKGTLAQGRDVCVGPDAEGCFKTVCVCGLFNGDATPTERMYAGQYGCMFIERTEIKPGMVAIADFMFQTSCFEFDVEVITFCDKRCFTVGSEYVAHCNAVKQTVRVITANPVNDNEEKEEENAGGAQKKKPTLKLRFIQHPEYVPVGSLVIFRDGSTKALARVTRITPFYPKKVLMAMGAGGGGGDIASVNSSITTTATTTTSAFTSSSSSIFRSSCTCHNHRIPGRTSPSPSSSTSSASSFSTSTSPSVVSDEVKPHSVTPNIL